MQIRVVAKGNIGFWTVAMGWFTGGHSKNEFPTTSDIMWFADRWRMLPSYGV